MEHFIETFNKKHGKDMPKDKRGAGRQAFRLYDWVTGPRLALQFFLLRLYDGVAGSWLALQPFPAPPVRLGDRVLLDVNAELAGRLFPGSGTVPRQGVS